VVKWLVRDPTTTSQCFCIDDGGKVYKSSDSGTTWSLLNGNTVGLGQGLCIWKDYLFVARTTSLDTYGPLSGQTFTVTIASPGVFTASQNHGLAANDTIIFSTSGALPTGITAGTVYYIIAAGLSATDFEISATQGGAAINTSGTQSGTHKYTAWKSGNVFKTIDSDTLWHPMLLSKLDGKLYGGAGRFIYVFLIVCRLC
jgi:hypothetical protein